MSEVMAGESVKIVVEGNDADGQILNRATFEAFGLTREQANLAGANIADGLVATVRSWAAAG